MVLGSLFVDETWQVILDSIQPGGDNWAAFKTSKSGGCLKTCPAYSKCYDDGPNGVCSSRWRKALASPEILNVLFHVCNNFDYYNQGDLPGFNKDSEVVKAIRQFLFDKTRGDDAEETTPEEDEVGLGIEDLRKLRAHKTYERNRKLAADAKQVHGWVCQACGFDFQATYGEIGRGYIEAHHLLPLSKLKGTKAVLDPKLHFCVLCSNCHRMIHRSEHAENLEAFKKTYITKRSDSFKK